LPFYDEVQITKLGQNAKTSGTNPRTCPSSYTVKICPAAADAIASDRSIRLWRSTALNHPRTNEAFSAAQRNESRHLLS